ncbi:MAG TPA: Zn-dependent hydrolase [Cyclobacteriaceae bacterium]|nr:Zn-dependent hydrolase [Cyclobacteriaceae bacterium]
MHRRSFIKKTSLVTAGVSLLNSFHLNAEAAGTVAVNSARIEQRILELAKFGRDANGHGYRVAYTQGDIEGRAWFMNLMKQAGLDPTIDAGGNIIGKRKGKNSSLKPIAFGSHIDMVPDGGNYDGTLGSLGALEVIEVLNENNIITEHPLEVIIFGNEEGGTIGSRAMTAGLTKEGLLQKSQSGLTMAEGINAIGGRPDEIAKTVRKKGDIKAFLELHIEQGGILEKEKIQIGVVEGIVGIVRWDVTVEGFANHAGATPMNMRQDALLAASKFVVAANEVINSVPGSQVGTVGKLAVQPGAYNVIPGRVILGLEIRDLSAEKIERLFNEMEKRATAISSASGTKISFARQANESMPALTDKSLQQVIDKTAKSLGFTTKFMQSGAGHDSQHMADIAPVAMIFIPSIGGISHSPKEFSTTADMTNGVNVLLNTIMAVDRS